MDKKIIDDLEDVDIQYDETHKKKKKKRIGKILLFLFTIILIFGFIWTMLFSSIMSLKNIEISGNSFLNDKEIISWGNIHKGKSTVFAMLTEVESNIESHEIVKNAKVDYKGVDTVKIVVEEEPILFSTVDGVYLTSGTFVKTDLSFPIADFENFKDVQDKDQVLEEFSKLYDKAPDVYEYISQISYSPDSVIENRIMILMRDSNVIYLKTDQISNKMIEYFNVIDAIFSEYGRIYGVLSFDKGGEFKPY
ncbi:MAG: cell division protein FtsQ/DivIB [Bacilli bacterium]